jgi:hypothetical protein
MRSTWLLIGGFAASLSAGDVSAQMDGMNMEVFQKWSEAKVIRYKVEGLHNAPEIVIAGDFGSKADVIDRLTVEFTWDVLESRVVGDVSVTDGTSEVSNVRSEGTNCEPPQLKGQYEHFQSVSTSTPADDLIQITGERRYPDAMAPNYPASCSLSPVAGSAEVENLWVPGSGAEALGMPITKDAHIVISADRTSFSVPGAGNWVWTYIPTLVQ